MTLEEFMNVHSDDVLQLIEDGVLTEEEHDQLVEEWIGIQA